MTGNPLRDQSPFFYLTWIDLKGRMPFATPMQLYDAAEQLREVLNQTFTREARKLAFYYETPPAEPIHEDGEH
jgi:hypothetical protein